MARKALGLLMLVAVVLAGTIFAGCGPKKQDELTALRLENENLKGQVMSQRDLAGENQALQSELAQAKQDISRLEAEGSKGPVGMVSPGMVGELSGSLSFAPGSDKLTSAGKSQLDPIANKIRSQYSGRQISVEGHTDSSPLVRTKEKWHTNMWLSANRARAAADYLISQGISENLISVAGHGASRPSGGGAEQDRRVEIIVLSQ